MFLRECRAPHAGHKRSRKTRCVRKQKMAAQAAVMTAPGQAEVASAVVKIGTRGSPLAMAQAYQTKDKLQVSTTAVNQYTFVKLLTGLISRSIFLMI